MMNTMEELPNDDLAADTGYDMMRMHPKSAGAKSAGAKSGKSGSSAKSKASISVTLPKAAAEDLERSSPVHVRSLSPDRQKVVEKRNQHTSVQHSFSPQSVGTIPPQATPTRPMLSQNEIRRIVATRMIEQAWLTYRDRQMFKLLKHAVCAAEHSMSYEILRKVSPKEAELLKDKSMPAKVRFRFGGEEFPPMIFFKIFASAKSTGGMGVHYVSGKKMIQPASEAARDACDLMGHRKFYEQFLQDTMQYNTHGVVDEVDVTTLKDYMQYLSLLDETPAYMGGRDNSWRKLTLEVLPRATIFYDVVSYLYDSARAMTPRLRSELPSLLVRPLTEDVQLQHIRIISTLRSPDPPNVPSSTPKVLPGDKKTSRRSRQAKLRVLKMRKVYEDAKEGDEVSQEPSVTAPPSQKPQPTRHMFIDEGDNGDDDAEEGWEEEAEKLYEWTQELSMDDVSLAQHVATAYPV